MSVSCNVLSKCRCDAKKNKQKKKHLGSLEDMPFEMGGILQDRNASIAWCI